MIIEIKDIPNNQLIKHISVDITFFENGDIEKIIQQPEKDDSSKVPEPPESSPTRIITDALVTNDRPKIEIPSEMLDFEM